MIEMIAIDEWGIPVVQGDYPPPCSGFTLTSLSDSQAIMFGGYHSAKGKVNTVYIAELTKDIVVSVIIIIHNLILFSFL